MTQLQQLENANSSGVNILYIDPNTHWENSFQDSTISWDAAPAALTFATKSNLHIDGRQIIIVDSNRELLGFYFMPQKISGQKIHLELFFCPKFKGGLAHAPGRPAGFTMGASLDKVALDAYLKNLRKFIK